jgi:magnesium chelatase family protein
LVEIAAIQSATGLLSGKPLCLLRPFRAPHHTISSAGLLGTGATPGELSLAHRGVLFLDELPEFHRDVLECLRQPLEDGWVAVSRARRFARLPARCIVVAAMNPCPCGFFTDSSRQCRCSSRQIQRYLGKISGPLLDRIDLHVEVPALPPDAVTSTGCGDTSAHMSARIRRADQWRAARGQPQPNACLRPRELAAAAGLTAEARQLLSAGVKELALSARSHSKILKVARTIADLSQEAVIQPEQIAEAMQYRSLDRQVWG